MKARIDERLDLDSDVVEHGRTAEGEPTSLDRRLYMQLHAFGGVRDSRVLVSALGEAGVEGVLYDDVNDPSGVALLTLSETPDFFVTTVRSFLGAPPFSELVHKPELTMFGRTYASGFETDLDDWLLRRPRRAALNPAWPWGIWYPLRRTGSFSKLTPQEQGTVIREHSVLGRAYGDADLAHDVRLACHGLDAHDNDFVIGLVGRQLHPLSHLVQAMRKTTQTSQYLQTLGPFFVGHALWQSPYAG